MRTIEYEVMGQSGHSRRLVFWHLRRPACVAEVPPADGLLDADADQQDDADRPDHDELDRVPSCPQHQEVEPRVAAGLDQSDEVLRGEPVRDGEEHREEAPFEAAAAGADRVEHDVARRVTQDIADVGAGFPEQSEHGVGFSLIARSVTRQCV